MDIQQEAFAEEANELLAELEDALLELEETPDDDEKIGRVFRSMHTIKGSGAMFGFDAVAEFTHNVESVYDQVRSGHIPVSRELVNLTLSARDHIKKLLDAFGTDATPDNADALMIIQGLNSLMGNPPGKKDSPENTDSSGNERMTTYRVRFKPHPDIFSNGTNPLYLLDELRELGECTVVAHTEEIPLLEELRPEYCYLSWDVILTSPCHENHIMDVFIFVEDESRITIDVVAQDAPSGEASQDKLGEILVNRGTLDSEDLRKALDSQKRIGEILVRENISSKSEITSALAEQSRIKNRQSQKQEKAETSSVRVPAEKLDQLLDLVSELVTVQARLGQKALASGNPDLMTIAEEVEALAGGLRDNTMSVRMVQIGTTFATFRRLVRDLSNSLGKRIDLSTEGGETELDKTVIEQLKDPLVHMIRNAIDHGIERPELRREAGKDEVGKIHLCARHSGDHVLITIEDDGQGLDPEKIRKKAIEKGIVPENEMLTDHEARNLLFAPGFSTAETVTDISGRGVGMDVVKKSIESVRGSIELSSTTGRGTLLTLKLPLTLAIIDGLLVTIGSGYFVLPLCSVKECVEMPPEQRKNHTSSNIMNIRGDIVPFIRLRDIYGINGNQPEREHVVIMETGGNHVGFVVDHVIGGHQTVIKNLGTTFKQARDISGSTILSNGTVALIIDVDKIASS